MGSATYEVIRQRLRTQGAALREGMTQLDTRRREVFGSVEFKLLQSDRVTTAHNCLPRDMVQFGRGRFLFGFNVQFGLKREIDLGDVFGIYQRDAESGSFKEAPLDVLQDRAFITDFKRLYNVYERATFSKFSLIEGRLYMVFQVGAGVNDIAVFKWAFQGGQVRYLDGRAETEFKKVGFPPTHEFRWLIPDRESFRYGDHPHVSIEDRVFVECVGGDLTIKVEDNTATGEGIYSEPVEDRNQKVDDAEIGYALIEHLIILRIRPYKEEATRYFIFNEKQQSVVRIDTIGQSCALLPEGHGLIFPDGFYLGSGDLKRFEARERDMILERIVHAPTGEDSLYVFYNRETGQYVLLPYRLIPQKVEERITCNGFSLFADGNLLLFRADDEPQKHHTIQLRQTPFFQPGNEPPGKRDAFLYQVGNKDVVRCLAEINEMLTLIGRESPYAELYADLVKRCGTILDAFPWLGSEDGFGLNATLRQVGESADKAVEEFDKVRRLQREALQKVRDLRQRCDERFNTIRRASFRALNDYVLNLAALRQLRGDIVTLREVRYADLAQLTQLEDAVGAHAAELSKACVGFLLKPEALEPARKQAAAHLASVDQVTKAADGRKIEAAVSQAASELEMLIEIVNNLRIEDATEATRIIDGITSIYATLNQVRAALKKRLQSLVAAEGAAQFAAQLKLLSQSASSFLDLCDTPAKCEEYLNRITVQLEELEGAFADFEEYTVLLSEKRTALYEAFEQRKVALVEQRNRRAGAQMTAAERILKVIQNRLASFQSVEEIHTYMSADLMVGKVREIIDALMALEDSVKADDLQGRLKTVQQEAVRQLKDRQELFVDGTSVIQLGRHRFNINTQPLDLTVVIRDDAPQLHITGTKFFEPIQDDAFLATRSVWNLEVGSESPEVYRAEYLAWQCMGSLAQNGLAARVVPGAPGASARTAVEVLAMKEAERLAFVQEFMGARYQEGYTKGVHDLDATRIFHALVSTHQALQLARYHPVARACAVVYWFRFCTADTRALWTAKLNGFAERNRLFPGDPLQGDYVAGLQALIAGFVTATKLFPEDVVPAAGEYLFQERISGDTFVVSQEADRLAVGFLQHLAAKGREQAFTQGRRALADHPASEWELVRDWVRGFVLDRPEAQAHVEEAAAVIFAGSELRRAVVTAATTQTLDGMKGLHPVLKDSRYAFDYRGFRERLERFERDVVPRHAEFQRLKQQLLERERARLRLDEFKPRVLSSFVRNQLIDQVYLPMVGDNLAKQVGAAGSAKRTDLMGMLLLVSPPGYGKTTLMEYVASRLGIVFIKINGPALGHAVTSLDPTEAPNAAAREEVQRLNLALEMGDNVMICVDDIQHCNPEFLQKFISLCDAQRKMEGVWRGQPRTYDLRGRKVVVVMAGNPYTESGQKFKIPDMLSNRADTYNLGDIIGGRIDSFRASYLENAVTSNAVLAPLAARSQKDIRTFIRMAETGSRDADGFEGSYSSQEIAEILSVLQKLVAVREVVLRVNQNYIQSAAQADEFRTEPPFKLQGSYRNMNRLSEKVVAVMNDAEVAALIADHYRNESQTLTAGAEANLLKFKELIGTQTADESKRWEEIRKTFRHNLLMQGGGQADAVGRIVGQLAHFQTGLGAIQQTLERQLDRALSPATMDLAPVTQGLEALRLVLEERRQDPQPTAASAAPVPQPELVGLLGDGLKALREDLSRAIAAVHTGSMAEKVASLSHEMEMIHSTMATLKDVASRQRDHLRNVEELLATRAKQGTVEIELTQEMLTNDRAFLERFHQVLEGAQKGAGTGPGTPQAG